MPEIFRVTNQHAQPAKLVVRGSRGRPEEEPAILPRVAEIEHLRNRASDPIKRSLPDALPIQPVVFNEVDDRTLIRHRVIDKVLPRPRRDHEQRQPRSVPAPAHRWRATYAR